MYDGQKNEVAKIKLKASFMKDKKFSKKQMD